MKIFKLLFKILLILVILFLVFFGVFVFKSKAIIQNSLEIRDNLELTLKNINEKNFIEAKSYTLKTKEGIEKIEKDLEILKKDFFAKPFNFFNELEEINELIKISSLIIDNSYQALEIIEETGLDSINNISSNNHNLSSLSYYIPEIKGIKANLILINEKLSDIKLKGWLSPVSKKFESIKKEINYSINQLENIFYLVELSPYIFSPEKENNFLLVFQNNDELRPSGGFIGSFSVLRSVDNKYEIAESSDSYHLDMPVKDTLDTSPPEIISKYLKTEKWFLRDSNWYPSWDDSATNILNIYDEILKAWPKDRDKPFVEDFSGVISITPDVISDILKVTGPIAVDGKLFTSENFHHELQYIVEISYVNEGISSWDRKDIINDLINKLEDKIKYLSNQDFLKLFYTLSNSLEKKDILFYFKESYPQSIVSNLNWSGEIRKVEGDYIYINDANLASLKTDAVIERSFKYSLSDKDIEKDKLQAKLNLSYENTAEKADWRTSRYQSYTRIYLPINAENIEVNGFKSDLLITTDENKNKKVVSGIILVPLGSKKEISLTYTLAKKDFLIDNKYNLYIQKQTGTNWMYDVSINITDLNKLSEVNTGMFSNIDDDNIYWKGVLETDKKFNLTW
ncbi:DUF4012 domain-containing protein [bacterium]|nr:DUF4012 domain-containing protein [bacterium]